MVQDEAWSTGKRYVDMTAYWQWRAAGRRNAQEGGPTLTAYSEVIVHLTYPLYV